MAHREVFKLKGIEYAIPQNWKEKILDISDIVGIYEPYPAHMSGRRIPKDEICLSKSGRNLLVIKEEHAKLPNLVALPPFLKYLENYIKSELIRRKCPEKGPDFKRLKVYQEVFNFLIIAFRIYGPLLNDIKSQYDKKLLSCKQKIREFLPYNRQLCQYYQTVDEEVNYFAKLDSREKRYLGQQKKSMEDKIENIENKQLLFKSKIDNSRTALSDLHVKYIEEFDARKLMNIDADNMRSQIDDMQQIKDACKGFNDVNIHPENLILFIKVAKVALQEVTHTLDELKEKYKDVYPSNDFDNMRDSIASLEEDIAEMTEQRENMTAELNEVSKKLQITIPERNYLYLQYEKANDASLVKVNHELVIRSLQIVAREKLPESVAVLSMTSRLLNTKIASTQENGQENTPDTIYPVKNLKGNRSLHEILNDIETILDYPKGFIMEFREKIPNLSTPCRSLSITSAISEKSDQIEEI